MSLLHEGKLYIESEFPKNYSDIIYLAEGEIQWNTNGDIIFRLENDNTLTSLSNTIRINYWYELKQEKYQLLFYSCLKIMIPNKNYYLLFNEDLHEKIVCYQEIVNLPKNIKQFKISEKIIHVEEIFKKYLKINENKYNLKEPCYFFGVYNLIDLDNIKNHEGIKHIIFGGSDLDINMNHCKKIIPLLKNFIEKRTDVKIYFISKNLKNRGKELGLSGTLVRLEMVDKKWTSDDLSEIIKRESIYCYTGCKKLGKLYNYDLIKEIEKNLPKYNFIYSHNLNVSNNEMKNIYKKCFVGLRLTKKDGNANTVIEMGKLGIPVLFNGEEINSIPYKYENIDDIIIKIESVKNLEI